MNPICWLVRRRLDAYRDGELAPGVRARVETHLAGCRRCPEELAALTGLHEALAARDLDEPAEPVWDAFWPQVRARLAEVPAVGGRERAAWASSGTRRHLVLAPALAAAALAVLAVVAPWQEPPPAVTPGGTGPRAVVASLEPAALDDVVVQSIETADPDAPVMVYSSPESDVTVLWVFGLERTNT